MTSIGHLKRSHGSVVDSLTRGRGVKAAQQTFNLAGEGSTPSGPTSVDAVVRVNRLSTPDAGRRTQDPLGGTKVLAAACLALTQVGEGSSPSGPTGFSSGVFIAPMM